MNSFSYFNDAWKHIKSSAGHAYEAAANGAYSAASTARAGLTGLLGASAYSSVSGHLMGFNAISSAASYAGVEYAPTVAAGLKTGLMWMVSNPLTAVGCFVSGALLLNPEGVTNALKHAGYSSYHTIMAVKEGAVAAYDIAAGIVVGASELYETISSYLPEAIEVKVSVADDNISFVNKLQEKGFDISGLLGITSEEEDATLALFAA